MLTSGRRFFWQPAILWLLNVHAACRPPRHRVPQAGKFEECSAPGDPSQREGPLCRLRHVRWAAVLARILGITDSLDPLGPALWVDLTPRLCAGLPWGDVGPEAGGVYWLF